MSKPDITDTTAYLQYLESQINLTRAGADTAWIASCTYLVFFMQAGFALLEAGSTRHKNYVYALFKNLIVGMITTLCWWLVGYAIAFGDSHSGVIGTTFFGTSMVTTYDQVNNWMFQWAFADTASTIISGCLLERIKLWPYAILCTVMSSWIYPMFAHWAWNPLGWLKVMGYHDFAGCAVIHTVGGVAGLVTSIVIGPRKGRFAPGSDENEYKPADTCMSTLAVFLLWFCWYGFNCGSTGVVVGEAVTHLVGKIGINTSISASSAGLTVFFIHYFRNKGTNSEYSLSALFNGVLAGLVGITASCDGVEPFCAFFIGAIAGFIYVGYTMLFIKLKIDDPIDAVAVHMGTGMWGAIAFGIFDQSTGFLYGNGGRQFGVQILGVVVAVAWTAANTFIVAIIFKLLGIIRISEEEEALGSDLTHFGGFVHQYDDVARKYYAKLFFETYTTAGKTPEDKNVIKIELTEKIVIKGDELRPVHSEGNNLKSDS
jgi:Amt family ammonium transporter